ncbi:hypothetical protein LCGC14_3140430, partial [marine sediment metagenome]
MAKNGKKAQEKRSLLDLVLDKAQKAISVGS